MKRKILVNCTFSVFTEVDNSLSNVEMYHAITSQIHDGIIKPTSGSISEINLFDRDTFEPIIFGSDTCEPLAEAIKN